MKKIRSLALGFSFLAAFAFITEVQSIPSRSAASPSVGAEASAPYPARPQSAQSGARKIDEFGDIQISDWLARADNFAIELQNSPGATGYIVAYGVPNKYPGWPLRRGYWVKGYLVTGRSIPAEHVEVVNGGYRDSVMFQLWLVEAGAQLPVQPFDLRAALVREKSPFLFDQFYVLDPSPSLGIEDGYEGYLDVKGRFEPFVLALRADPAARGCVIAYATRRNRHGTDRQLAARTKRLISTTHAIGADRIVAVSGGLRKERTVELWIVPPGADLPKPTPTVRPARRKRR